MKKRAALIFGYNDYALEIAKNISDIYENISLFSLHTKVDAVQKSSEYEIKGFDLSDEWDELEADVDMQKSIAFCVLEESAENIFLTISLRSSFKDLNIIALSNNKQTANKLQMAGANKVIPLVQTTAEMIVEMLEKPIVKEVFHTILFESASLKIAQVKICDASSYIGESILNIDWDKNYGIIVLALVNKDMSSDFIYASKIKQHIISKGDLFIVVGYENDIKKFENETGNYCD